MSYEELFYGLLRSLTEPLFIINAARECVFANEAFRGLIKVPEEKSDLLETSLFFPDIASLDLSPRERTLTFQESNGSRFSVKATAHPLGHGNALVRVVGGGEKNSGHGGFHSQRLETLGMLAGGVAHDFNNILAGILGHVSYLKTILPAKGPHVESLIAVEEGGKKASVMTQQILNFSKFESGEKPVQVNVNDLVTKTCLLLRGAISPSYKLERKLDETPRSILASAGGLAQVLVNLVINARDALAQNGAIKVEVATEEDRDLLRKVFKTTDLASHRYVRLSVEDNGHGMTPEIIERIFEPYFTTKEDKGTGLGLATVQTIVKTYGGAIDVASKVGVGTTISVYFPEAELGQARGEQGTEPRRMRLPGGDESILVVDDEFPVRNVLCMSLQHLGYRVDSAASGLEAIEKFGTSGAHYDLVLLDMLMPNMPGEKVFFRLKEIRQDLRVLVISGYTSEESVKNILSNGGIDFLQKPFTIEELSRKVRDCIDREVPG